ncbi:hypothetical protein LIP_3418 [Limnochorda pilosa]|uniref:Uncharacterized protein n=1 Tax=Limnochorda pilosa TaxID=1555112 RepID=A0A0K2SQ34_LIMPI|nr:hypothetical protein LIP_3418 [Limnochorda pilosa]
MRLPRPLDQPPADPPRACRPGHLCHGRLRLRDRGSVAGRALLGRKRGTSTNPPPAPASVPITPREQPTAARTAATHETGGHSSLERAGSTGSSSEAPIEVPYWVSYGNHYFYRANLSTSPNGFVSPSCAPHLPPAPSVATGV